MSFKTTCCFLVVVSLLAGCSNYVYNSDFYKKEEPIFVRKTEPVIEPEPAPIPEPVPVMSVAEQNNQAIESLNALGFESLESEQGVIVYLPPNIYFSSNTADISLDARTKIAQIASEVNKEYLVDREIEVSGHTDSVGSEDLNMATSKRRAEAASEELIFSKVALTRIKTTWFGEKKPRVNDRTADGQLIPENRALNRRVEFTILNPGQ